LASGFTLKAASREAGHPRRDRALGFVPAVVYGHGLQPLALKVEGHALGTLLAHGGARHLLDLSVEGEAEPRTVVFKEIQRHPVSRHVVHVDFQAVSARERIHAEVPLRFLGEEEVSRSGGVLEIVLHQLRITCLPADLPDHAEVDVSQLAVGRSLAVKDVRMSGSVTALNDPDEILVRVASPRASGAEGGAAAGEAAAGETKA